MIYINLLKSELKIRDLLQNIDNYKNLPDNLYSFSLSNSLDFLFLGIHLPIFSIIENNKIKILFGEDTIASIYYFINNKVAYPKSGSIKEFHGLYFSDLHKKYQRVFLEVEITIKNISESGNNEQKSLYLETINNLKKQIRY